LVALAEDTDLIPSIHTVAHNYAHLIPVPGDSTLTSEGSSIHVIHTHTHKGKHIHTVFFFFKYRKTLTQKEVGERRKF
jgi:hypothetical protein